MCPGKIQLMIQHQESFQQGQRVRKETGGLVSSLQPEAPRKLASRSNVTSARSMGAEKEKVEL
jgi:hypothetical protein